MAKTKANVITQHPKMINGLPADIPAGIRTNVERIIRAIKRNEFAIVGSGPIGGANTDYAFCEIDQRPADGKGPVVTILATIVDASDEHEIRELDFAKGKPI